MISIKEQIVKTVVKSGNGGAVWVPRNWMGEKVIVTLPEKPKLSLNEQIINILMPYLKDITAVFLYGSYARNEQTVDSDIDILVISNKKFKIYTKNKKIDLIVVKLEELKNTIKKNPIYFELIKGAKSVINSKLLGELKNIKLDFKNFKWFLGTTKDHIKSNKELIELDKLTNKYLSSYSVVHSTMVRLRGIFIIKCIIKNKEYSNRSFKKWILKHKINSLDYDKIYNVYKAIRDDIRIKNIKVEIILAEKLLKILIEEIKILEEKLYGK